LAY
ncbi:hypothetical protein D018_5120B, partial [Vibrio parahaemolyticus VP2007-007]|jgi:hypothetical protein